MPTTTKTCFCLSHQVTPRSATMDVLNATATLAVIELSQVCFLL